jgi:uncharacterized protein (TIGR02300 family)
MAKPEWGTKRTGPCGTKFYDFNKSPIICPSCGGEVIINKVKNKDIKIKEKPSDNLPQNKEENNEDDISVLLDDDINNIEVENDIKLSGNEKDDELQDVINGDHSLDIDDENIEDNDDKSI